MPPLRPEPKMIRLPSCDQIGEISSVGSDVKRVRKPRATSYSQRSFVLRAGSSTLTTAR